jgi:predicted nucleic-acid-binding protein
MIGIDTNILVRLTMRDDEAQFIAAQDFVAQKLSSAQPGFICVIAVVEFVWTLRRVFKLSDDSAIAALEKLQDMLNVEFEHQPLIAAAIQLSKDTGGDFADMLIFLVNRENGCGYTATFDGHFARTGMANLVPSAAQ